MATIKLNRAELNYIINESVKRILTESSYKETVKNILEDTSSTQPDYDSYENLPKLSSLPNGVYNGLHYGYVFELKDGKKFETPTGIRCYRKHCGGYKDYKVENGEIFPLNKNRK